MCYTYDEVGRVTRRVVKDMCDVVLSDEAYTYDAAGNVTDAPNSYFLYDTNNRLVTFNFKAVAQMKRVISPCYERGEIFQFVAK